MAGINLGPDHALALRLTKMEEDIAALSTQASYVELAARVTYSATNPGLALSWSGSLPTTSLGISLSFTLDQQRKVTLLGSASVDLTAIGPSASNQVGLSFIITPSGYSPVNTVISPGLFVGTSATIESITYPSAIQQFIIPAGTSTVTATAATEVGGSGTSGFISLPSVILFIGPPA